MSLLAHLPGVHIANIVGYISGTFIAITAIALYRREDARRSTNPWYSPVPRYNIYSYAILVVGLLSATAHIWYLSEIVPS